RSGCPRCGVNGARDRRELGRAARRQPARRAPPDCRPRAVANRRRDGHERDAVAAIRGHGAVDRPDSRNIRRAPPCAPGMEATARVPRGRLTARGFCTRLAEQAARVMHQSTADGIVFRVDLRLRPEGTNGPIVNSAANALTYYESWGQTWERAAYLKARPVAG